MSLSAMVVANVMCTMASCGTPDHSTDYEDLRPDHSYDNHTEKHTAA